MKRKVGLLVNSITFNRLDIIDDVGKDWEEVNVEENQNMKIQRILQNGDSIIEIINCARLVGLELNGKIRHISSINI